MLSRERRERPAGSREEPRPSPEKPCRSSEHVHGCTEARSKPVTGTRCREPSLRAGVEAPVAVTAAEAAAIRPRERTNHGVGPGAFWPQEARPEGPRPCAPRGEHHDAFSFALKPPSTKPAAHERHQTSPAVAQQPARTTPAAASLQPSAKRVTREQMCRELRLHHKGSRVTDQAKIMLNREISCPQVHTKL